MRTTQVQVRRVSSRRKHQYVLCSAGATGDIGESENKNLERKEEQSERRLHIIYNKKEQAGLAVEHVWIKFRFHMAWGFGVGGNRYAKTVSSGRET